ncbi:glycosyltransferase [Lusitaniella coriacea]|uniref:glycosyltransferase n=1 Tax=Lusitaniella coriacea TaxID=1983105 RepID=UPI003CECDCF8
MTTVLGSLLIILTLGAIVFYLACLGCTLYFFTQPDRALKSDDPPVSIMVPVCGLDAGAWENWSSLCQQDYPNYEVLFGVVDPKDPAVVVLEKLVATFPARSRIKVGLEPRGINHKDSTLSYLLEEAKNEVIIFVDSDIRVNKDYIRTVTAPLTDPEVGMVTCAFVGRNPESLGGAIASYGRCVDFIPSLLLARILDGGLRCAVGATIATRKSTLADYDGLHLNRIGSDYNIGKRAAAAGYRVELSRYILNSDTGKESLRDVFQRELRWARTIRFNRGAQYYTMIFCYGTIFSLPLPFLPGFHTQGIIICAIAWLIRYLQVLIALLLLNCPKLLRWLWIVPLRDFLSVLVWAMGAFGNSVYWRGRRLRVEGDGIISPWDRRGDEVTG